MRLCDDFSRFFPSFSSFFFHEMRTWSRQEPKKMGKRRLHGEPRFFFCDVCFFFVGSRLHDIATLTRRRRMDLIQLTQTLILWSQLSPEIFDPRKMDPNFLEANFEYFRLSTGRDDENQQNCPSYFSVFGLKSC